MCIRDSYKEGYSYADSVATDGSGNKLLRYSFNLSKYIQNIASGKETNTDLYIANYGYAGIDGSVNTLGSSALFFNYSPARLVLAGSNYSDPRFKMKLNIIYTLLK